MGFSWVSFPRQATSSILYWLNKFQSDNSRLVKPIIYVSMHLVMLKVYKIYLPLLEVLCTVGFYFGLKEYTSLTCS